jgi:hypothetical protein
MFSLKCAEGRAHRLGRRSQLALDRHQHTCLTSDPEARQLLEAVGHKPADSLGREVRVLDNRQCRRANQVPSRPGQTVILGVTKADQSLLVPQSLQGLLTIEVRQHE